MTLGAERNQGVVARCSCFLTTSHNTNISLCGFVYYTTNDWYRQCKLWDHNDDWSTKAITVLYSCDNIFKGLKSESHNSYILFWAWKMHWTSRSTHYPMINCPWIPKGRASWCNTIRKQHAPWLIAIQCIPTWCAAEASASRTWQKSI